MWKLLGLLFLNFSAAFPFGNKSFEIQNVFEMIRNSSFVDVNENCERDLLKFVNNMSELWALQMIDSMTKFPDGILLGHFGIPGHYDECVDVVTDSFTGKHCMADVKFRLLLPDIRHSLPIEGILNFTLKENNMIVFPFSYGICFPSTCSGSEIENIFEGLVPLNGQLTVKVNESQCSTSGYRPFRDEDWVTVGVLVFFCLIAVGSTYYDLYQRFNMKNENPSRLWSSFSIYTNGKQIFRISQSSSQLKCLHGIRFLSMTWVILAHAYAVFVMVSPMNMMDFPKMMTDKSFVPVSNGFVSVDSFFFLSGLLVCVVFFRDMSKKGTFDVPVAFIHRYMRLTPPFAILMLIQATIISRIGNGPFWNRSSEASEIGCRESWWAGLLYVQNFATPDATCLGQSWYLSADMQMYWLSPLFLYPLWWFPAFAPVLLLMFILAAALLNFSIAYINELAPSMILLGFENMVHMNSPNQFKIDYIPFYTRMSPYLVGMATGYVICGLQAKKIRLSLSKFWVIVGWMAGGALLGGSLFGIIRFMSSQYDPVESALYLAFHRVGWALGLSWVVIACVSGHGGIINDFLSLDFFQPLAKLSYCNFLVHMMLQNYRLGTSRVNPYIRHFDIVYSYFGDLMVSNLVSVPLALLFEFPFSNIDRHFFQKLVIFPLPKPTNRNKNEENEKNEEKGKLEKSAEPSKAVEEGKVNPTFVES